MGLAWAVEIEDVEDILQKNGIEKSELELHEIYLMIDEDRVEEAVLQYNSFEEQCAAAEREIKQILIEKGVI